MLTDGVNRTAPKPIEKPVEKPAPKPQTLVAQTAQNKTSLLGGNNYSAETLKYKLQNFVPTTQPAANPYSSKTADQIATEQLNKYKNASDEQASAEETGRLIADIAKYEPAKARAVSDKFLNDGAVDGSDKDELAQEMVRSLSDAEIKQIAASGDGQTLLKGMEGHLLSGSVHGDEIADADRISTALRDANGIFASNDQGVQPGSEYSVSPLNPDATPTEGAHFLKMETMMTDGAKSSMFAGALELHKNDPNWTRDFMAALGPEEAGRLINNTVNPSSYTAGGYGGNAEVMRENASHVLNALETLRQSGDLKQAGVDGLVNAMGKSFNPYVATDLLANASPELKEMFINSAIGNGGDNFDAAAMHLLNTLPTAQQSSILSGLTTGGNSDKLNAFIAGAMAGRTELPTLESAIENPSQSYQDAPKVTLGKVEDLLSLAADKTFQYYPYSAKSAFSEDLQNKLFNAASLGLDNSKAFENMKGNVAFKDNLSELFIQNRDAILTSNSSRENGAVTENGEKGLERFFQMTLMTPPRGEKYDQLSHSVFSYINEATTALADPKLKAGDPAAYENFARTHGGKSPEDYAQLLGGVLGTIVDGAGNAQVEINKDNKEKQQQIEFFTGLAFAMVPGAGGALAKGVSNQFVKHFAEQGIGYFQGKALGSIQETINNGLSSLASDKPGENGQLANTLYRQLLEKLPNGDAVYSPSEGRMIPTINLQEQLEAGFNNTTRYTLSDAAKGGK